MTIFIGPQVHLGSILWVCNLLVTDSLLVVETLLMTPSGGQICNQWQWNILKLASYGINSMGSLCLWQCFLNRSKL